MLIVNVDKNNNIEKALKTLKSKVINTKQTKILNERKEYTKKSVRRRTMILKAQFSERKSKGL